MLGALTALTALLLHGNGELAALPAGAGLLPRLRALTLQGNALAALPPNLAGWSGLEALDASDNALTALPESMRAMAALATLARCRRGAAAAGREERGGEGGCSRCRARPESWPGLSLTAALALTAAAAAFAHSSTPRRRTWAATSWTRCRRRCPA